MIRKLISVLLLSIPLGAFAYIDPQLDYVDWSQPNAIEIARQKQELRLRELQIEATQAEIQQTYSPTIINQQQQTIVTQGNNNTVVGNQQANY